MPRSSSQGVQKAAQKAPPTAPAFQPPRSIAIEGPIRVGKSTLARVLADRLHARRVFDPEDNPFLADFYKEKPGSAFRAQMYFLFEKHKIFAYVNLDNEELKLYEQYFEVFSATVKPPDLVIYLQATPEVLRDR